MHSPDHRSFSPDTAPRQPQGRDIRSRLSNHNGWKNRVGAALLTAAGMFGAEGCATPSRQGDTDTVYSPESGDGFRSAEERRLFRAMQIKNITHGMGWREEDARSLRMIAHGVSDRELESRLYSLANAINDSIPIARAYLGQQQGDERRLQQFSHEEVNDVWRRYEDATQALGSLSGRSIQSLCRSLTEVLQSHAVSSETVDRVLRQLLPRADVDLLDRESRSNRPNMRLEGELDTETTTLIAYIQQASGGVAYRSPHDRSTIDPRLGELAPRDADVYYLYIRDGRGFPGAMREAIPGLGTLAVEDARERIRGRLRAIYGDVRSNQELDERVTLSELQYIQAYCRYVEEARHPGSNDAYRGAAYNNDLPSGITFDAAPRAPRAVGTSSAPLMGDPYGDAASPAEDTRHHHRHRRHRDDDRRDGR